MANLDFDWQATNRTSVIFGIRNIFDRNYELTEGFPEPGRSPFPTTRLTFRGKDEATQSRQGADQNG